MLRSLKAGSRARPPWQRAPGRGLRARRDGVVSLEFAIIAIPFLILSMGAMELGFDFYVQGALDNAVQTAARSVQVGTTQGSANESSATLVMAAVCPNLHELLNCNQVIVGVSPLPSGAGDTPTDYYTAGLPGHFQIPLGSVNSAQGAASKNGATCTGTAGQLMLLQAWYIGPTFIGGLIPSFATNWIDQAGSTGTSLQHITSSSAGFVNEAFSGGQTGC